MTTLIIFIAAIAIAIIFYQIGKIRIKEPSVEQIARYNINNAEFINEIHPVVKEVYQLFIDKTNIKLFKEGYCNVNISNFDISIWASNDIYNRIFTMLPDNIIIKQNSTLDEINESLSMADKTILDHIVKAVKVNNKEFINRLFILKH